MVFQSPVTSAPSSYQELPTNEHEEISMKKGKVYLIGAGPGDPELLTLKGKRCLEEADVIVGDYLRIRVF